ncbi:MAG: NADP-dependent glyceraldehyde-3-phosphate dehydrogenase [Saprospiraceae bacterium]
MNQLSQLFPSENQVPVEWKMDQPFHQKHYLVNGELREWKGEMQEVVSPIYIKTETGLQPKILGSYPLISEEAAMEALQAANRAYDYGRGEWPTISVEQRILHVEAFVQQMKGMRDHVIRFLMWEIGKNLVDSAKEFDRTLQYILDTIESLKKIDREGSQFILAEGVIAQIRRSPVGTVLCMGPFNYPLNETFTLLIPALIMGNTLVFKVPRQGALVHEPFLKAFAECFPKGVVNVIYGHGRVVIPPMMSSGKVDVLTLIGSSKMADNLRKLHPKTNRLRAVFGLDAKNAGIITENADLDLAAKECVLGALSYNGQRCTALKIFFVHKNIVAVFIEKLNVEISKLKLGMPWEEGVNITPVAEPDKPQYHRTCIDEAIQYGAKIMNEGGGNIELSFVTPTVLYPVNDKMKTYHEEQFGPIIPITSFENISEPIDYIIQSEYGQQVSIFGSDAHEIAKLVDPLTNQVCRVNINSQCQRGPDVFPFTGRKDSAERTLSVHHALMAFSINTMIAAKATETNKSILNEIISHNESNFISTRFIF